MRSFLLIVLSSLLLFSCDSDRVRSADPKVEETPFTAKPSKKLSKQDRMDLAWQHEFQMTRDLSTNSIPKEAMRKAKENLKRQQALLDRKARASIPGITWEERGPNNVPGRTRAFLFDASDPSNNTVFAGSVSGGLWKNSDFQSPTPTWTHQNEFWNNLAISAIVQDPGNSNIIYVGTGEGWSNFDAVVGQGIWKSTNGGNTFSQLLVTNVIIDVNDLEVAANGDLYVATRFFGLLKSTNGGSTFTTVLSTLENGLNLSGVSTPAANNRMGDLEIGADGDLYVANYGEIWKSDAATYGTATGDVGNWVRIFPPASGTGSASSAARTELATAPSDPDRLYILCQGSASKDVTEMYRSENVGSDPLSSAPTYATLTIPTIIDQGNNSIFTRGQAWYDLIARVDPNHPDTLYIGGVDALRSTDKGLTWTQITTWSLFGAAGYGAAQNVHADHHNIIFEPGSSTNAIITSDGGIDYSSDINNTSALPSFTTKSINYNTTQFYSVAVHPGNFVDYFLGGTQDNGSQQFSAAGINTTVSVTGGDGGFCHIDQTNPNTQITSNIFSSYRISTNGFATESAYNFGSSSGKFINPSDYDDVNNILYSSFDADQFLRVSNIEGTPTANTFNFGTFGGNEVSAVTVSPNVPGNVYLGLDAVGTSFDGDIYLITNANTPTPSVSRILESSTLSNASGYVSSIAVEEGNESHILITYSNYGVNSVWETTNGGASWNDREGDLPNIPIRWIMFAPGQSNQALIATELGVWSTDDLSAPSGTDWEPSNTDLANVRVDMLQTRASDDIIAAASHGRGLYTTAFFSTPEVNFLGANFQAVESNAGGTGTAPDDCLGFVDYSIEVSITKAPSADAEVEITLGGGSSATDSVDFSLFPRTLTFTPGGPSSQLLTLRVYEDATLDSVEEIVLQLNVSNPGLTDAVNGSASEKSITIFDNHFKPDPADDFHQIGPGGFFAGSISPFRGDMEDRKIQYLYDAADLIAAGITAGPIKGLALFIHTKASTQPYQNFTIKMGQTSLTTNPGSPLKFEPIQTTVFNGNVSTALGVWNDFEFSQPFIWDGSSSILVEMCYDNASSTGIDEILVSDLTATGNRYSWYDGVGTGSGCGFTNFSFISSLQPSIRFYDALENPVEDQLESIERYVGPNDTVFFYDSDNRIVCSIANGPHDFGCTTVEIDRSVASAGAPSVEFWQAATTYHLLAKTLNFSPTFNDNTASYELTVYVTQAEVDNWAAATGKTINDIKFLKTEGIRISDVTPTGPNFNNQVDSALASSSPFGSNYALTASFTDGFSGFGFGDPGPANTPMPVEFLDFQAEYLGSEIQLDWSTATEVNNKGFFVERALDGRSFEEIGFVEGRGSSSQVEFYDFLDKSLPLRNQTYTYRLRQVDIDGAQDYSNTIEVFVSQKALDFKVIGKKLIFNEAPKSRLSIDLYDLEGKKVSSIFSGDLQGKEVNFDRSRLSHGIYLISVVLADGRFLTKKWMNRD